jgi:hypothetical protein
MQSTDNQFVIIDKFREYFKPNGGFDWRTSKFIFLDKNGKEYNLTLNDWTIEDVVTTYKSSNRIAFDVVISDRTKKIRRILLELYINIIYGDNNMNDLQIVKSSYEQLKMNSQFNDWEQLDLEKENKKLKAEITKLRAEIANYSAPSPTN